MNPKEAIKQLDLAGESLRKQATDDLKTYGLHSPACRYTEDSLRFCPLCRCIRKWEGK